MTIGKIDITRTLLQKPVDSLNECEKKAVESFKESRKQFNKRLEEANKKIAKDCKVLCSRNHHPIPDYGWMPPVESLCYNIEAINIEMAQYGIRVILEQSKEKYGGLRFYTSIEMKEIGFFGKIIRFVDWINNTLSNVNYGIVYKTDEKEYKSVEWMEITKEQFDNKTNEVGFSFPSSKKISTIKSKNEIKSLTEHEDTIFFVEENGKFYYSYILHHMAKRHPEFTKHKILHKIFEITLGLSTLLTRFYKTTSEQEIMLKMVDNMVDNMVNNTKSKCYNVCQHCGIPLNDNEPYQRCETQGWYMYVCEDCAKASGMVYRKGKKLYREGVELPDKSESVSPDK